MATAVGDIHDFTRNDRMGLSVFSSMLIHMLVILGLSFTLPKLSQLEGLPTLEITLVQTRSEQAPEKAEFLAQANQDGGGSGESPQIASNPLPVWEIGETPNQVPLHQSSPQPEVQTQQERQELLTQKNAKQRINTQQPEPEQMQLMQQPENPGLLDSSAIARERARLNAEIDRSYQEMQQMPKRKYLNARTREYKYAAYQEAWRAKVERVGQLNYPEEALRKGLSGRLLLDVALNADGSINEVSVRQSSGHKLLDDAAIRIVALAAPFSPFPPSIREETDILHITRYWLLNKNGWVSDR